MARIYIDARNITENPSGIATYAKSLIPELVKQAPEHRFKVIRHSSNQTPLFETAPNLDEIFVDLYIDRVPNFLFGHRKLKAIFNNRGWPDLYHSLFHIISRGLKKDSFDFPIVTTLHDLIWIDHPDESQSSWLEAKAIEQFAGFAIPETLETADRVISVSEPTRRRATEWIEPDKATVISHGVESDFFNPPKPQDAPIEGLSQTSKIITAVGNDKDYKNLKRLIAAFSLIDSTEKEAQLVLIGSCDRLQPVVTSLGLSENQVLFPGFVDKKQLLEILSLTDLFVFPSLIEGFGLPIIEAMAAEIPVITSDREPMRSVAGDAARLVDPLDTEQMAQAIETLLNDPKRQSSLSKASKNHASNFTWPRAASKTLSLYNEELGYR